MWIYIHAGRWSVSAGSPLCIIDDYKTLGKCKILFREFENGGLLIKKEKEKLSDYAFQKALK